MIQEQPLSPRNQADVTLVAEPPSAEEDDDQVHSDQDEQPTAIKFSEEPAQEGTDEEWEEVPWRERGETDALEPISVLPAQTKLLAEKELQVTQNQSGSQSSSKVEGQDLAKQEAEPPAKRKDRKKYEEKQVKQAKVFDLPVDSKFIYAMFYLMREQVLRVVKREDGFIKINPYINNKVIKIFYYDNPKRDQIANRIEDLMGEIQMVPLQKRQIDSGVFLSAKYMQQLRNKSMTIIKDDTQNYLSESYYICGKVSSEKVLLKNVSEMRKMHFSWLRLLKMSNTRSYRAILRKVFETSQMRSLAGEKLRAKLIEVGDEKKLASESTRIDEGVLVVLTSLEKNTTNHSEVERVLTSFIKETFRIVCFLFNRQKQYYNLRFAPKVDNVTWFFIKECKASYQYAYLYIIVAVEHLPAARQSIIDEIGSMKINIFGRRYFKNLHPERPQKTASQQYRVFRYPPSFAYSWTYKAMKGHSYNWKEDIQQL